MITFLFFILTITFVSIEIRYRPRFDKVNGRTIIWYNLYGYSTQREYIFLDEI